MHFFESIIYMAWRGIAIGLIISAPMGPVGMLCIQRTLDKGRRAGFYTGVGAALSDLFYCLLTGFGLSFIEEFLERNSNVIQLVGSAVLIGFGVYLFMKNPARNIKRPSDQEVSIKKNILGGFLFTFSNPLILFLIIGLFARFNFLLPEFKIYQYFTGFAFIFVGAIIWWWIITFAISKVRHHFNLRSMWLINKIIGSIILIFAIVGIITATSALVKGASPSRIACWNNTRGFESFSSQWPAYTDASPGTLRNLSADTMRVMTLASDECELCFKITNLHCTPGKNYVYRDSSGLQGKAVMPPWGIGIAGFHGEEISLLIESTESAADMLSSEPALKISLYENGIRKEETLFSRQSNLIKKLKSSERGPDPTGSQNFYKMKIADGSLRLYGGLHAPSLLMEYQLPEGFHTDSVGYILTPGAAVTLADMRLSDYYSTPDSDHLTWNSPSALETHLENSVDTMEGYWQIIDRSLEESLLKMGGDYRLAMVKTKEGYSLLYLSGARVNAEQWTFGMPKVYLHPSGIEGIWDVVWIDATHTPLSHELKAQQDKDGTLSIQFPYQSSRLRLVRTK